MFDFDGTLIDLPKADTHALEKLCQQIAPSHSSQKFADIAIDETMKFHRLVEEHLANPLDMPPYRLKKACMQLNIPWHDRFLSLYKKHFYHYPAFQGTIDLFKKIRPYVKTGIITNAYDTLEQHERIRLTGFQPYVDVITVAAEIGIYKPSPEIFHYTLKKIATLPQHAIYIGDNIKYDIEGARAASMTTILLNSKQKPSPANFSVKSISELDSLLQTLIFS